MPECKTCHRPIDGSSRLVWECFQCWHARTHPDPLSDDSGAIRERLPLMPEDVQYILPEHLAVWPVVED